MTKKVKEAKQGTEHNPLPWSDPFPASYLDAKGKETVFVAAIPTQDIIVNGTTMGAGKVATMGADFAHAHAGALKSPLEE